MTVLKAMYRGDTRIMTLTVVDQDGDLIPLADLEASTIVLTVRGYPAADDVEFEKSSEEAGEITPIEDGLCEVLILPADTDLLDPGTHWFDVQITTADDKIWTLDCGEWPILRDMTRPA